MALMVMDDLIEKGQRSDYAILLPKEMRLAGHVRKAEAINLEYAQNPRQAEFISYGRYEKTRRFYEVKLHTEFTGIFTKTTHILSANSVCRTGSYEACMGIREKGLPEGNAESQKAILAKIARLPQTDEARK
ncbi:hypothetical protein NB640_12085 [Oxalobacter vibrioformis]|uniref:Uncharacterized protein n=1 Tax=Oxalobacter vibrioformis TaxID=933080 RepID=A0A9E9P3F5_9BURK|nr:hypothetical protein [Oxalobacter vibrioformis]WAW09943.1 hypothetical protein NB640_12085 [Oxalobacter vibrioformis]